jgi:hypothetical protein
MKNKLNLKDVKQIDVHAERLDKCAIVDAIQILLVKINECIYHFFFVKCLCDIDLLLCIITEILISPYLTLQALKKG